MKQVIVGSITEHHSFPFTFPFLFDEAAEPFISTIKTDCLDESSYWNSQRKILRTANGILHAIYHRVESGYVNIFHAYSNDNGETWTEEALTSGNYAQADASIAIDSQDCLHVVWYGYSPSSPSYLQIKYRKYDGSWGSIIELTSGSYHQYIPSLAVDVDDHLHIVWRGKHSGSPSYDQIRYIKYDGSWSSIENLTSGNYQQFFPCIAIDGNNYLHIVWQGKHTGSPTYFQVRYIKYTDSWQTIENLTSDSYSQSVPTIGIDENDYLHVFWAGSYSESPTYYQIRYRKHVSSWGDIENLTAAGEEQYCPGALWAGHPEGLNVPASGYAFIWVDDTTLKYYASYDLVWEGIVLKPSFVASIAQVVQPTVILGSVSITPDPAESIAQVVQPAVVAGNIIFSPTPIDAIGRAVSPSVIYGPIIPSPISAIGGRVNPVVVLTSISITPTSIEAIGQVVAPIVSIGADVLYITPTPVDAIGARVNPTVILGSISLTPDALSAIGQVVAPNAVQGNIIFSPAFIKALGAVVAPTVIDGSLTLEPEFIEAIARGENPEVILGSMTITPEFVKAIAGVVAPYVIQSWLGRKLRLVILTTQNRKVNVTTCQNRKVNVVTGQKRKVRVITGA